MIATSRWLVALAVLAIAAPVRAQPAEAEALFREGKRLLAAGDTAGACDKLDASERLDPACGTELNLADCLERDGQLASAWAMFVKAEQTAKRIDDRKRGAEARRRAARLLPRLVYLTIDVDHPIDGLVVERNGAALDRVLWNQRLPLDPDEYQIVASAPGRVTWSTTVSLRTESRTVTVPALDPVPADKPVVERSARVDPPVRARDESPDRDDDEPREVAPPRRFGALSLTLAVVGVGALATGAGFGYISQQLETRSDQLCPSVACSDPQAVGQNLRSRRDALVADAAFVGGGVALATAATLWLLGRPGKARTERLAAAPLVGGVGIVLGGHF